MTTIYDFECSDSQGKSVSLQDYKGKVLLIVNTASKCGFTPQFAGLETLYRDYREDGFEILGFPCNQFGQQDPGSNSEITEFCQRNYGVSFPMMGKIAVNGPKAEPLYQYLKSEARGALGSKSIKWNFTKFLIGRQGEVVARFGPTTKPASIEDAIREQLQS